VLSGVEVCVLPSSTVVVLAFAFCCDSSNSSSGPSLAASLPSSDSMSDPENTEPFEAPDFEDFDADFCLTGVPST
jgi:hypothetical protein